MEENLDNTEKISISARAVLHHLNSLGYTDISGQQLKYFMKDLKKLIKHDTERISEKEFQPDPLTKGPERLHDVPTYSWKSKCSNKENKTSTIHSSKPNSAPSAGRNHFNERTIDRDADKPPQSPENILKECKSTRVNNNKEKLDDVYPIKSNLIKVHNIEKRKKSDPVALYHYYASLWEKYKPNLPGENDWADLRWSIREKLVGAESHRPSSATQKGSIKKRKEWVN